MRVLIAPDSYSGSLTATEVAETMAAGWREHAPDDELTLLPLSDGGPGFLEVVHRALGGDLVSVLVSDPLGRTVPSAYLVHDEGDRRTAYVEAGQACGLHLLGEDEQDPAVTSTYGVGQLLAAVLEAEPTRIVVGLGGSGTNDGGAGALAALGAGDESALARGGVALAALPDDALADLQRVRERFRGIDLVLAGDLDITLLGFHGASAAYAGGKGATPEVAQQLEAALGHFTDVATRSGPLPTDLLSGEPRRLEREPGAGADGGLGFGLMLLGGHFRPGVEVVLETVRFDDLLATHHLLVTGEGSLDWQSTHGTVVSAVAEAALGHAVPTVVVAGQSSLSRRETMTLGISGTYVVARNPDEVLLALADPVGTLRTLCRRVAVTWSA